MLVGPIGAASTLLRTLVVAIRRHVLAASKLHAKHTPIPVLALGNRKTKTAPVCTYVYDDRPAGETTPHGFRNSLKVNNFGAAIRASRRDVYNGMGYIQLYRCIR